MPPIEQQPPQNQSASNVLAVINGSFELSQCTDHKKYLSKSMIQRSQSSLQLQAFLDQSKSQISPPKRASTVNKFLCKWDNCNQMFDTRGQLMSHVRVLHTEPLEGILFEPQLTTTIEIAPPEVVDFDLILDRTNESLTQEPVISDVHSNFIIDPIGTKENVVPSSSSSCSGKLIMKHKKHHLRKGTNSKCNFDGNEVPTSTPKRIKTMMITTNEQMLPQAASTPFQPKVDETDLDKHLTEISKSVLRTPIELQSTTRSTRSSVLNLRTSNTEYELIESKVVLKDPTEQSEPNDSTTLNVSHSKMNKLFKYKDCSKSYQFEKHLLNHCQKIHQQSNKLPTQIRHLRSTTNYKVETTTNSPYSSSSSSSTSPTKPMSTKSKQAKSEQERLFVCPHVGCTSSFTIRDIYKHVQSHSKS